MDLTPHNWVQLLQRPWNVVPPDDRKLDASYSLGRDSLVSILPGEHLDDRIINTFFRNLCVVKPGQFVTFDSVSLEDLRVREQGLQTQAEIDEHYKSFRTLAATVTANAGLVFMPFCVNSHWVLAVADFQHRIIRIYDSLVSCDSTGRYIQGSDVVEMILPIAKRTLSFCHDADQWGWEPVWLPILPNYTDCGVYICLMALQHSYKRGFTYLDYVHSFWHENEYLAHYALDDSYFLAGRLIILQVCRRFFRRAEDLRETRNVENCIISDLRQQLVEAPAQQPVNNFNTYHEARFGTLYRVSVALLWLTKLIEFLGSLHVLFLQENIDIQFTAPDVVLSEAGEPFRDEIAYESWLYAWHDAEAAINFRQDLLAAWDHLSQAITHARARLAIRAAGEAQPAPAVVPTGHCQSITHHVTPVPSELEESETEP